LYVVGMIILAFIGAKTQFNYNKEEEDIDLDQYS
jgi:hypothetical protein